MRCVRHRDHLVALCHHLLGEAVVDLVRCQQAQTRVVVLVVVPGEEPPAKGLCVLQAAKPVGEVPSVRERLELRFGIGVIIAPPRPAGRFRDAQRGQKLRHHLGCHRGAPVGVQSGLLRPNSVLYEGLVEQFPDKTAACGLAGHPADDVAAVQVQKSRRASSRRRVSARPA